MAGIGPAIKTTGITGGNNKPGDASGSKNKVAALSISNITDKEKAIENGQNPDATAEVAKDDKQNTGSTTTKKVSAEEAAKNATQTPRERLVGHIEEMNKTLQKFQEENNGKIAEAQAFGQQAQQNKAAEEMAKMMAMQQAQQPKQETPKASTPSQSKPSGSSSQESKKLAENDKNLLDKLKQVNENQSKLAEAFKKEKAKNESPETKLKEAQLALETRKANGTEADDSKRSGAADKALEASGESKTPKSPFSDDQKFTLSTLIGELKELSPSEQKAVLTSLNKFTEADSSIKPIEEKAKGIVESKPSSSVDEATTTAIASRSDLEAYDDNSFNLDIKPESRSEDISQDLERDTDQTLNEVEQDTKEVIEESQEEIEEVQQEEADIQAQEELDALLEQINIDDEE
jgi:hypothetical protein